jgi:hypothetical protein
MERVFSKGNGNAFCEHAERPPSNKARQGHMSCYGREQAAVYLKG